MGLFLYKLFYFQKCCNWMVFMKFLLLLHEPQHYFFAVVVSNKVKLLLNIQYINILNKIIFFHFNERKESPEVEHILLILWCLWVQLSFWVRTKIIVQDIVQTQWLYYPVEPTLILSFSNEPGYASAILLEFIRNDSLHSPFKFWCKNVLVTNGQSTRWDFCLCLYVSKRDT